jgi:cyclase
MYKHRLIPKLQMRSSKYQPDKMVLVTTINFDETVEIGDPISQAKIFDAQSADELIFLDLDASKDNRETLIHIVKKAAEQIFIPLTVGGGVRSINDFGLLLANGADKISFNTGAVKNPDIINEASTRFGSSTVVISIDYKNRNEKYSVWVNGGKKETNLEPVEWAVECEKRGAGEILLCSIDKDGTKAGLDLEITERTSKAISIPVITSGGCGLASHFSDGYLKGKAHAVSAGTYFCFKDQSFMQVRAHINNAGIPIRLHT